MENQAHEVAGNVPAEAPETAITKEVAATIHFTAKKMIGTSNLNQSDLEDLKQELSFAVIQAFENYTVDKGSYVTFTNLVIDRAAKKVFRYRIRKNIDSPMFSLENLMEQEADEQQKISQDLCDVLAQDYHTANCLKDDVAKILLTLSDTEKSICELIMDGYSQEQARRQLGFSTYAFYHRLMPSIKQAFADYADFF
jgi:DNA-directed RNA polymerase specialized sigma24 family protein